MFKKVKLTAPQLMHGRMLEVGVVHVVSEAFAKDFVTRGVGEIVAQNAEPDPAPVAAPAHEQKPEEAKSALEPVVAAPAAKAPAKK